MKILANQIAANEESGTNQIVNRDVSSPKPLRSNKQYISHLLIFRVLHKSIVADVRQVEDREANRNDA